MNIIFNDPVLLRIKSSWMYHSVISQHLNSNEFTLLRKKCGNTGCWRKMIQTSRHQQFEWNGYIRILDIPSCRKILQTSKTRNSSEIMKAFRFLKIDLEGAIDLVLRNGCQTNMKTGIYMVNSKRERLLLSLDCF